MCAICGIVDLTGLLDADQQLVRSMAHELRHRGPDGEGFFFDANTGLGNRRLRVIDLETGDQPIANEDGSVVITFNGEIYNYRPLREELVKAGHRFSTRSDTEVIIHLYEEHGEDCVLRLRGMFAFAIWDRPRKRLMIARDRLGKKPIYYAILGNQLIFASELKALLCHPGAPRRINGRAFDEFLTLLYVPPPETIFEGIFKLPPAHVLVYDESGVQSWRYWDLDSVREISMEEGDVIQALTEKLKEATALRMLSDVPLGAFLSGGVDSSIVVATMSAASPEPVRTFSIGFDEESHNELQYARRVAEQFGTHHREFLVQPDAAEVLPKLVWYFDEPFADPSAIPTYYLSQMAREHVTVALNGDGGDESFAGYGKYLGHRFRRLYRLLPQAMRRQAIGPILDFIPEGSDQKSVLNRLKRHNALSLLPSPEDDIGASVYNGWYRWRDQLYTDEFRRTVVEDPLDRLRGFFGRVASRSSLDRFLYTDLMTYLPDDLLIKADRMTMAHGLEGRSPFLDHELIEFAFSLPWRMKLKGRTLKYALRQVGLQLGLPREHLYRYKQGFEVPIAEWLRKDLREMRMDLLSNSRAVSLGFIRQGAIDRMVQAHDQGAKNHAERIWSLMNFELWCQVFLKSSRPS